MPIRSFLTLSRGSLDRYDEAVALLQPLAKAEPPEQTAYADQAKQVIGQLVAQRDRRRAEAEAAYQEASLRFSASDDEGAGSILEDVPPALRSEAAEDLLAQVKNRQRETASLHDELETAIRSGRLLTLLPKVDRLLTLRPDHSRAKELARQLQDRLCRAAKRKLTQHRYDAALKRPC